MLKKLSSQDEIKQLRVKLEKLIVNNSYLLNNEEILRLSQCLDMEILKYIKGQKE